MSGIDFSGLSSWQVALLIGIGLWWGISNGMLDTSYRFGGGFLQVEGLASMIVVGAVLLGGFHFTKDVINKL